MYLEGISCGWCMIAWSYHKSNICKMVCFILCDKYFCCFAMPKKKLPVKHLNCDIRAPWHVPREYECIGAHTMRYCAVQPCLHRTNSAMGSCENALTESTHTRHWKCIIHTLYFNPSVVHLSSWLKWGRPKAVWSAPSIVVCMLSLSWVQWLQRYIYIPRSKQTCTTGNGWCY